MIEPYLFLLRIADDGQVTIEGGLTIATVEFLYQGDPDYLPEEMGLQPSTDQVPGYYVCQGSFTMEQVPESSFDHYIPEWSTDLIKIQENVLAGLHWVVNRLAEEFQALYNHDKKPNPVVHQGLHIERLADPNSARERFFLEQWQGDESHFLIALLNKPRGLPGVLWTPYDKTPVHSITQRDATVAATIIQWLGSNIGFAFLEMVLKKAGYSLIRKKD